MYISGAVILVLFHGSWLNYRVGASFIIARKMCLSPVVMPHILILVYTLNNPSLSFNVNL